jgi:hypothetical protein
LLLAAPWCIMIDARWASRTLSAAAPTEGRRSRTDTR